MDWCADMNDYDTTFFLYNLSSNTAYNSEGMGGVTCAQ